MKGTIVLLEGGHSTFVKDTTPEALREALDWSAAEHGDKRLVPLPGTEGLIWPKRVVALFPA